MFLHPAQAEIASDTHRFRVLRCGRRFGKTVLAVEEMKGVAISRETRIAYIANTYQQARDITWEMLKKELQPAIVNQNEQRLELKIRTQDGGVSHLVLRGWESIENLRGQAFDFLVPDEVAMMRNFWVGWHEVLRPTLTDRKGSALFLSTPKGYNHFYDLANLELKDPNFKSFHFTSYDNPHLPKEEIDNAKDTLPPDRFSQEYLAEFEKTAGLVYKEFSRDLHTYDLLPYGQYEKVGGIDFGYTNPAAVLDARITGETIYIENEWYKPGRTDEQVAAHVSTYKFRVVYPDPAKPEAIESLRQWKVNVHEVTKGKDSVEHGVQMVRDALLSNRLKINKRCINLINEFETYSYDDEDDEVNRKEKPLKANDHALDALRYLIMTHRFRNPRPKKKKNSAVRGKGMRGV